MPGARRNFRAEYAARPWQGFSFSHDNGFKTYVEAAGIPGDFNNDGTVTAADYVTWRKYLGDPTEAALNGHGDNQNGVDRRLHLWRTHFATGGAAATLAAVPEPVRYSYWSLGPFRCRSRARRRYYV